MAVLLKEEEDENHGTGGVHAEQHWGVESESQEPDLILAQLSHLTDIFSDMTTMRRSAVQTRPQKPDRSSRSDMITCSDSDMILIEVLSLDC